MGRILDSYQVPANGQECRQPTSLVLTDRPTYLPTDLPTDRSTTQPTNPPTDRPSDRINRLTSPASRSRRCCPVHLFLPRVGYYEHA